LVLDAEALQNRPVDALNRVWDFLGVEQVHAPSEAEMYQR
jgi:hypothetical protein